VILTLDFAESGISTGQHVYRTTTGNCEVVSCLKRAVQGFKTAPHKSMNWKYSAYLSRSSGKGTGWAIDPSKDWDKFIAKADANDNCVEETPQLTGRLPPEVIQKTIREHYDLFRKCYEAGLGRDRNLCGRVQVRFVIDEDGRVPSVQVNEGTNLTDCEAVQCIKKRYLELQFPKPEGGIVTVVYPIMFEPG
jgi:TonB family protein